MKKYFILDWSGFLYRAYFGLPKLINNNWQNINVVYWFTKMILNIILQKPDYFCIAWDMPEKTIRHQKFEQYKATRPPIPDDFKQQIPLIQELIWQLKIHSLGVWWYEADDIIYTLTLDFKNVSESTDILTIFSSDKDLRQLIDDNVFIQDPMTFKKYDKIVFLEKYWFDSKYMIDYLSLLWDSSDNIPWVEWIWEKTATNLVKQFWTLDNIYNNIESISPSVQAKLLKWKENAYLSYDLIKLIKVPDLPSINSFKFEMNLDSWKELLLSKWKFKSLENIISKIDQKYNTPQQQSLF